MKLFKMRLKKFTTIATLFIFTSSILGCSQNVTNTKAGTTEKGTTNTGSSQVAGSGSQVNKILVRVAIGLAISAIISSVARKKQEDAIEDTIRDVLNPQ